MRPAYDRLATLDEVLRRAGELSPKTLVFDVEPLVAPWDSGQDALDQGVASVLARNGVRAEYLGVAGNPLGTEYYRAFPRPDVVIGDELATHGALGRRIGY